MSDGVVDGTDVRDRAAGVLLAQAVGDALGVPYEFGAPPPGDPEMIGGGLGPYAPGEYSDDTQMTVCVARVAATGAHLADEDSLDAVADGFLGWLAGGASDVGNQTREVLGGVVPGPGSAARIRERARALHERTGRSAGNGALMRTAVVGLTSLRDREATADAARAVAALTHHDPLAAESCVLWTEAVRVAVLGGDPDPAAGLDLLPASRRDAWAGWIAEATGAAPASFPNNGFTVTALQAAWAAVSSAGDDDGAAERMRAGLFAAVRAGNDADTVAAIAGGLLGAWLGAAAVPAGWRDAVHGWPGLRAADLEDMALRIVA